MIVTGTGTVLRAMLQVIIARWLGPAAYGRFVVARGWGELLAGLPDRGYRLAVVRDLPNLGRSNPGARRSYIAAAERFTARNAAILSAGAIATAFFIQRENSGTTIAGLTLVFTLALAVIYKHMFQGIHRYATGQAFAELMIPIVFAALLGVIWLTGDPSATTLDPRGREVELTIEGQPPVVERQLVGGVQPETAANEEQGRPRGLKSPLGADANFVAVIHLKRPVGGRQVVTGEEQDGKILGQLRIVDPAVVEQHGQRLVLPGNPGPEAGRHVKGSAQVVPRPPGRSGNGSPVAGLMFWTPREKSVPLLKVAPTLKVSSGVCHRTPVVYPMSLSSPVWV